MTCNMLIVIPAIAQHRPVVEISIARLKLRYPDAKFMVVCPSLDDFSNLSDCRVNVTSDESLAPVSKVELTRALAPSKRHLAGWYYQQLLKYAAVTASKSTRVLVLDADTVILDDITCKPGTFFTSKERNASYFEHFNQMFGINPILQGSAIVNFMWFESQALRTMLATIESEHKQDWWNVIISIANNIKTAGAFSEYETYANWYAAWAGKHIEIPISIFRRGDLLLRHRDDYLRVASSVEKKSYHAVAFELNHQNTLIRRIATRLAFHLGLRLW